MASVSVIIPCYNGERYLAEAIESILAQTYPVTEIIVVDNASTDNSKAVVARYPQVKYIHIYPNQGPSGACNKGISESIGEYIVVLDFDDRLLPNAIEIGISNLQNHPDCMFAFGPCRLIDEYGLPHHAEIDRNVLEKPVVGSAYEYLLRGTCLNPLGRHIVRRSLFDKIGGFDTSMYSAYDYDFYLRALNVFPCVSHAETVVEYRQHPNSISLRYASSKHLRQFLTIYSKQKKFIQANPQYISAYREGLSRWTSMMMHDYVFYEVLTCLKEGKFKEAISVLLLVLRYNPGGIMKVIAKTITPA